MFPSYVVAAPSRRPGPSPMGADARREQSGGYLPLGVRHAVPSGRDESMQTRTALCGEPVTGWFMFLNLEFRGSNAADCRRCEQLLSMRADKQHTS